MNINYMNTKKIIVMMMGISSLGALQLFAAPLIIVQVPVPTISVQVPAPAVIVEAPVPDTYVWDGVEFVGLVGTQYYYLGPDKVWLSFDAGRLARFHDWERAHADWRTHAIHNELYRHGVRAHDAPLHDVSHDSSHDASHDNGHDNHDKDHDHDH